MLVAGTLIFARDAFLALVTHLSLDTVAVGLVLHCLALDTVFTVGELASMEALLNAIIERLANVGVIGAVKILFALVSFLLSAAILQIVGISRVARETFTLRLMMS